MGEHATILVVDDEAVVRRVLGDTLAQAGHRVRTVAGGEEALAALADEPADLILLDLQLGDADGVEIMRAAREHWPETQLIVLTAHGSMTSAIAAVRHDAADYLLKPIGVDALRARVAEVLERHRAGRRRQEHIRTLYEQLRVIVDDRPRATPAPQLARAAGGTVYNAGPLSVDVSRYLVRIGGRSVDVTPAEFAILQSLARVPGAAVPCRQIVQSFQGGVADEEEARQMLRPHIVRLRRKLEPDPARPIYIQSVRGVGYRWGDGAA
jgi:DNA-binding response OmpR family regulator